jgi:hypothetical protein
MSSMFNYNASRYVSDGANVLLHRKLAWILRTYKEWRLPRGRTDVFEALAKASRLGME